jgi:hypothetical protein
MILWIINFTILSIVFIFLVHHLLLFFKSTLTVPKVKDLVHAPAQKYEAIFKAMNNDNANTDADAAPAAENSMKDELKQFMKKQFSTEL